MYRSARYSDNETLTIYDVVQTIKNSDCVILYSPWCGYSKKALTLLNKMKVNHKSIDIENIEGSMNEIRMALSKDKTIQFPFDYSTRPMVFINGRFIGGYSELAEQF